MEHLVAQPSLTNNEQTEHWSFLPIQVKPLPKLVQDVDASWPRNGIDSWVLSEMKKNGLRPMPQAPRRILIRRLKLDLLGLLPTIEETREFEADESQGAYEKWVNRFLSSPRYGERQALRWLDLARFAETDGFEHDKIRAQAWRYRDWVVQSLNQDLPYDLFVKFQLAGDELVPDNQAAQIATMFCMSGPDMPDINSQSERRHFLLNEMTSTMGGVFLALQIGCAQCHDHKYDPVSQKEFYQLRAIFQSAVHVKKNQSISQLEEKRSNEKSYLMVRGDYQRRGVEVHPGFPRVLNKEKEVIKDNPSSKSFTGRRSQLANWITRPDHPLTARVLVNRLWQDHFGAGLVTTPSDFGHMGARPSHPNLLDWLAAELVRANWSMKQMRYLMVTSSVYRQASSPQFSVEVVGSRQRWKESKGRDPENRLISRYPRRRLDGEILRDCMLQMSGALNFKMSGPGIRPPLSEEIAQTLLKDQWLVTTEEEEHTRRSVYVFSRRNLRYPFFEIFDRPDANHSCPKRNTSVTAPQALVLLNSQFSLACARRFAGRVLRDSPSDELFVRRAFRLAVGREIRDNERVESLDYLENQKMQKGGGNKKRDRSSYPLPLPETMPPGPSIAYTQYCLVLFNLLEFCYSP